jgi:hypothetical protein
LAHTETTRSTTRIPWRASLAAIRNAGAQVQEIVLAPLNADDLTHLIADALGCEQLRAMSLAQLVDEKTGGNPFFVNQFLNELADERLVTFDPDRAAWRWDPAPIRAKGFTDNVVELMAGKLSRLPHRTQEAVKGLACLGNSAEASMLASVHGTSKEELHSDLWEALRLELIVHSEHWYRFAHDRVQEAAYSLIPEEQRAPAHLRIGRLLAAEIDPRKREDNVFDIVGHLNRASSLMTASEDRVELAALNLMAGKRAKSAAAYASALNYLIEGATVLPGDVWERRRALVFELEFQRAGCEFLTGGHDFRRGKARHAFTAGHQRVERGSSGHSAGRYPVHSSATRPRRRYLSRVPSSGRTRFSNAADGEQAQAAYAPHPFETRGALDRRSGNLPLLTDPDARATLDVLAKVIPCALSMDRNLLTLIVCAARRPQSRAWQLRQLLLRVRVLWLCCRRALR